MRSDQLDTFKYLLGILTSRFRANHPLKFCALCAESDRKSFGTAYWHLMHQLPGVWVCKQHLSALVVAKGKTDGTGRFQWLLPGHAIVKEGVILDTSSHPAFLALADAAEGLFGLPEGFHFESSVLINTYLSVLLERSWATTNRQLRTKKMSNAFVDFCRPFRLIEELATLPATPDQAASQLGKLFRQPRSGTHPLRHLIVIVWLFDSWKLFYETYCQKLDKNTKPTAPVTISATKSTLMILQRQRVVQMISSGSSAQSAATATGVSTTTAICWAEQEMLAVKRRPKTLLPATREKLIHRLASGDAKEEIETQLGVSRPTIDRVLRCEPGLQERREQLLLERKRDARRAVWLQALSTNPGLSTKQLKLLNPAIYAWLYRCDRTWLMQCCKASKAKAKGNNCKVSWDERDRDYADKLKNAALKLQTEIPGTAIRRHMLLRLVPELYPKMSNLRQLPLTVRQLEIALSRKGSQGGRDPELL